MTGAHAAAARPARVLVADDAPTARHAVAAELRARGFDVVVAASADEAARAGAADLAAALLDLDLGDGDGVDVARALRAASELPIAFFSADPSEAAVARARAFGPVFAKPDDLERAVDWIAAAARARTVPSPPPPPPPSRA